MLKYLFRANKYQWFSSALAYSAKAVIRLLLLSCRCEFHGLEQFVREATHSRCILMLWHNQLVPIAEILHRTAPQFTYTALISNNRDANPLAMMILSYRSGRFLRIARNAKYKGLKEIIHHINNHDHILLITPDGPQGPKHVLKPGVIIAAKATSAKIIPISWKANRNWILNTWDQLRIPKPFSKITISFGNPLIASSNDLKQDIALFQSALPT